MVNEGFWGSPTKNIIILVVTVTGQGDNPMFKLLEVLGWLLQISGWFSRELSFCWRNSEDWSQGRE